MTERQLSHSLPTERIGVYIAFIPHRFSLFSAHIETAFEMPFFDRNGERVPPLRGVGNRNGQGNMTTPVSRRGGVSWRTIGGIGDRFRKMCRLGGRKPRFGEMTLQEQ